jgi:cytoskeletal protein RodZ
VFEIGNSLREARVRQGLDFPAIEQATKIRGKYLRALEDEQFAVLPGDTYVKGFLRSYADYLGLDGQLYVDEFNSRYVVESEEAFRPQRTAYHPARRDRRLESRVLVLGLLGIAVVTALVIAAWRYGGAEQRTSFGAQPVATKAPVKLRLTGVRASSMVEIRNTTSRGTPLFAGTIQRGETIERNGRRLWIRIRVPHALRMTVNGKTLALPQRGPFSAVVTKRGLRQAAR